MTKTLRVIVADDSATVRGRLVEILRNNPDFEIVGEAEDGKRAIELCTRTRPDVITMDMMMPLMSGLAATEYIMAHFPTPTSSCRLRSIVANYSKFYEALAAGAVDVLEKPTGRDTGGVWEQQFITAVKRVARIRVITHPRARLAALTRQEPTCKTCKTPSRAAVLAQPAYRMVAIGASTGGPSAILQVLRALPAEFCLPILLVLHISEPFGAAFADWLDGQTSRPVRHARDGTAIAEAAGHVIVAPGTHHLVVRDHRLRLSQDPERHSCRPSVDVLFESVAAEYGAQAIACLLTGMGRDGALGLLKVRQAGGFTIAQDETTSVVYGMPREAINLGAATEVLRLGEIGTRLGTLQYTPLEARA